MSNTMKYFIFLTIFLMTTQALDINCFQLPTTHVRYVQTCCRFPRFKFHIFDRQCGHVAKKAGIFGLDRYLNPCALSCVFNTTGMIQNKYMLNLPRVYDVLNQLTDDTIFVRSYFNSFQACLPLVQTKIDKSIAKGRTGILHGRLCSNLPIMYGICAQTQTFLNCPRAAWTDSKMCNETKQFLRDCIEKS